MNKKYIPPIIITILVLIYCVGITISFLSISAVAPLGVYLLFLIIPILVGAGIVISLCQRIKEIKGGEEDEASKY